MARARALRKRDLRELGWKALVAELGVTNATRFVMELREGEQDYAQLRAKLFTKNSLDEIYAEIQRVQRLHRGHG
jgi:hypothetical protein